jgi:hypothetical protein
MSMKNSIETIGNRTRDLLAAAQYLNQLCYRVPCLEEGIFKISLSNSMALAPILNILHKLSLKAI